MRLKTFILSVVLGVCAPCVVQADVASIALRMNDEGRIIDIVTNASISMADAPVVNSDTQNGSTLNPTIGVAGNDSNLQQACEVLGGRMVTYNQASYCCDGAGHALIGTSQWSSYVLIPQCGCTSSYRKSFQTNSAGDYVCCNGYNMVSSKITGDGVDMVESELCRCPTTFTLNGQTVHVRDITATGSADLICCARDHKIQPDNNSTPWAACGCPTGEGFNNEDECEKQCSVKYLNLCTNLSSCSQNNGFWCGDADSKHCVAKQNCGNGLAQNEITCDCDNECSAASPTGCSSQETCSGVGGSWCPFGGCVAHMSECTCQNGGTLKPDQGVCCKDGWRATAGSNGYDALSVADCGCPKHNNIAVSANSGGVCCYNGKQYNETTKAYDTKSEHCCVGDHAQWNESTQTCSCKDDFVIQTDGSCGCPNGMVWSELRQKCVYCATSEHCAAKSPDKPYCKTDANNNLGECVACLYSEHCGACEKDQPVCDTSYYGGTYTCKSCASINAERPWRGRGLSDTTVCNSCYECIDDSDCANKEGKVCLRGTCVRCVHHNTTTGETPDRGCENGRICISSTDGKNQCAGCMNDKDCTDSEGDPDSERECNLSTHECQKKCGEAGVDPQTGECVCTGNTPVFNPNTRKCVYCYDSIAEDWTDLGCGTKKTDATYNPTEATNTPICIESARDGAGQCVRCTKNQHCGEGQVCRSSDHTCGCEDDTVWYSLANRCVSCTVNYGVDPGAGKACPKSTPTCSTKNYQCQCSENYDGTSGVGICPEQHPVCDSKNKTCRVCGSAKPYYRVADKACVTCGEHASWDKAGDQCRCARSYGVLKAKADKSKGCFASHAPTVRSCSDIERTVTKNCTAVALFSFTTVKGMLYHLEFSGTTTVDDQLQLKCSSQIISEGTTDRGNFIKEKNWCRNKSSSDSVACDKAESTQVTSADNIYIHGDGDTCGLYILNVTGDCDVHACTASSGAVIKVVPVETTFDYLADK